MKFLVFTLFFTLIFAGWLDDIKNKVNELGDKAQGSASSMLDNLQNTFTGMTNTNIDGKAWLDDLIEKGTQAQTDAKSNWGSFIGDLQGKVKSFTDNLPENPIASTTNGISDGLANLNPLDWLTEMTKDLPAMEDVVDISNAKDNVNNMIDNIKSQTGLTDIDTSFLDHMKGLVDGVSDLAKTNFGDLDTVKDSFSTKMTDYVNQIKSTYDDTKEIVNIGGFIEDLRQKTDGFFNINMNLPTISDIGDLENFRTTTQGAIEDAIKNIKDTVGMDGNVDILENLKSFVEEKSRALETLSVVDSLTDLLPNVKDQFNKVLEQLNSNELMPDSADFSKMLDGIKGGYESTLDSINVDEWRNFGDLDWIKANMTDVFNNLKDKLPSTDLVDRKKIEDALKGLTDSIDGKINAVELRDKVLDWIRVDQWVDNLAMQDVVDSIKNGGITEEHTEDFKNKLNDAFNFLKEGADKARDWGDVDGFSKIMNHTNDLIEGIRKQLPSTDSIDLEALSDFQEKISDLFNSINGDIGCTEYETDTENKEGRCTGFKTEVCVQQSNGGFIQNVLGLGGNKKNFKCTCCYDPAKALGLADDKLKCFEFFGGDNAESTSNCNGGVKECQSWPGVGDLCWCCGTDDILGDWDLPTNWEMPHIPDLTDNILKSFGCEQYGVESESVTDGKSGICTKEEKCIETAAGKDFGFSDQTCLCCSDLPDGDWAKIPQFKLGDLSGLMAKLPIYDLTQCDHYKGDSDSNPDVCPPGTHDEQCLWTGKIPMMNMNDNLCTCCPKSAKGKLPEFQLGGCRGYSSEKNGNADDCEAGKEACQKMGDGYFCTCCDWGDKIPSLSDITGAIPNVGDLGCKQYDELENAKHSDNCKHDPVCVDLQKIGMKAKHCVCCDGADAVLGPKNWQDTFDSIYNKKNNTVKADGSACNDVSFFDDKQVYSRQLKGSKKAGMTTCENKLDMTYDRDEACTGDVADNCCKSCEELAAYKATSEGDEADGKGADGEKKKPDSASAISILLVSFLGMFLW